MIKAGTGNKKFWNNGVLFFMSLMTALAVTMRLDVAEEAEAGITNSVYRGIYKIVEKISLDLADRGFALTVLTACICVVYYGFWRKRGAKPVRYSRLLSLFLAVMYTGGRGFSYNNTLGVLFTSGIRLMKTAVLVLGLYFLYLTVTNALYLLLCSDYDIKIKDSRFVRLYRRHPFGSVWAMIMGCWLFHILLRYPGTMSYDNWNQLAYYFGYYTYTTAQPVFHTWLFGSFIQIGLWMGSANAGLFLFVLFQSLIMSGVLARSLLLMRRWGTVVWLRFLAMAVYCIAPYYAGYASFPIKDFLYTAFFVLFVLYLMEWADEQEMFRVWNRRMAGWVAAVSAMMLCRNNGVYVYIPVALFLFLRQLRKDGVKKILVPAICLLLPFGIAKGTVGAISYVYQVEKDSPKEMFSLPFQQTARYVRDYGDEVTDEEREAISKVLDYGALPERYLELTADPVKTTYHAQTADELFDYFKVWFGQFWKHPLCYVEATWNQNYYVFAPNIDNIVYNKDCDVGKEIVRDTGLLEQVRLEVPEWMHGICAVMVSYYSLLTRMPVLGMFNNVAFYIILLFVICTFMRKDKCKREWLVMLPLLLSFLIILAAPQIQNQPRYAFPIVYTMPAVTAFYKWRRAREWQRW